MIEKIEEHINVFESLKRKYQDYLKENDWSDALNVIVEMNDHIQRLMQLKSMYIDWLKKRNLSDSPQIYLDFHNETFPDQKEL